MTLGSKRFVRDDDDNLVFWDISVAVPLQMTRKSKYKARDLILVLLYLVVRKLDRFQFGLEPQK